MALFLKTKFCAKIVDVYMPKYVCFVLLSVCVVVRNRDKERKRECDQDTTQKVTNQLASTQYLQG